ncbi:MAG TPA: HpsJ family protein, partial [Allocoleopsis sp.]
MKAESIAASYLSLILKIAGLLVIVGVLVDYIVLALPPNFLDATWLSNLIDEWVGRGTIPLIGLALILFGVWMGQSGVEVGNRNLLKGWVLLSLVLSAILGLLFLVVAPLSFRNSQLVSAAQTRKINEQAATAEQKLDSELELRRNQVSAILSNQELVNQLQERLQTSSEQSQADQAFLQQIQETLQEVQNDPKALDQKIADARKDGMKRIQEQKQQLIDQNAAQTRISRIRTVFTSLLLAIGYFFITWNSMNLAGSGRPRA